MVVPFAWQALSYPDDTGVRFLMAFMARGVGTTTGTVVIRPAASPADRPSRTLPSRGLRRADGPQLPGDYRHELPFVVAQRLGACPSLQHAHGGFPQRYRHLDHASGPQQVSDLLRCGPRGGKEGIDPATGAGGFGGLLLRVRHGVIISRRRRAGRIARLVRYGFRTVFPNRRAGLSP
ncbi:hypothetical protein CTZ27_30065 [Streptomyces griseocarneus]|nr:hypothetical protein CTZ27_30065 [Streptomyces griseocarneus]